MTEHAPARNLSRLIVALGDRCAPPGEYFNIGMVTHEDEDFITILELPILGGAEMRYMREELVITEITNTQAFKGSVEKAGRVIPFEHPHKQVTIRAVSLGDGASRSQNSAENT
mgnify:FL=1